MKKFIFVFALISFSAQAEGLSKSVEICQPSLNKLQAQWAMEFMGRGQLKPSEMSSYTNVIGALQHLTEKGDSGCATALKFKNRVDLLEKKFIDLRITSP